MKECPWLRLLDNRFRCGHPIIKVVFAAYEGSAHLRERRSGARINEK